MWCSPTTETCNFFVLIVVVTLLEISTTIIYISICILVYYVSGNIVFSKVCLYNDFNFICAKDCGTVSLKGYFSLYEGCIKFGVGLLEVPLRIFRDGFREKVFIGIPP